MKFFRFGTINNERPGVLVDGKKYDISKLITDIDDKLLEGRSLPSLKSLIEENLSTLPVVADEERLGVPLPNISKIVCVGLNFSDHVRETGLRQQEEPILFLKAISSLNGPFDGVTIPRGSQKTDWETELGVVIGTKASYVSQEEAMNYVAGYVLVNDVTERSYQTERGGTWDKGKGCDTFAPVGPYFVTRDEIPDENNLRIWLKLNGEYMQDGSTKDFIRGVPELLSYISEFMTLYPGDIISTGSPAGAGMGKTPQVFLKDGDEIEYGIDGLGEAKCKISGYKK